MPEQEENPVVNGFVALVAVGVVVGLLGGIAVLAATNMLGLRDQGPSTAGNTVGESLYMPDPVATESPSGPLVTLISPDGSDEASADPSESESEAESESPSGTATTEADRGTITLSQGAFQVEAGGQLYLSGIYPTGEGAVLDIEQRVNGGSWNEFPVDVNVSGGTFSVYVSTRSTGSIEWRVVDQSSGLKSNAVKVQHGD